MTLRDIEFVAHDGVNILIGYGRNTTGADVQAMQRTIALALEREASAPATPPGHVKMPASAGEARGMVLLGDAWLATNAPDRLDGPAIVALREIARTGGAYPGDSCAGAMAALARTALAHWPGVERNAHKPPAPTGAGRENGPGTATIGGDPSQGTRREKKSYGGTLLADDAGSGP